MSKVTWMKIEVVRYIWAIFGIISEYQRTSGLTVKKPLKTEVMFAADMAKIKGLLRRSSIFFMFLFKK